MDISFNYYPIVFWLLALASPTFAQSHQIVFQIDHTMDQESIDLQGKKYQDAAGNQFSIANLKYYISNIKLRNTRTGKFYLEPESYHLVSLSDTLTSTKLVLPHVVPGTYNQIEFSIGIDNDKNTSTDHIGDLDPANEMAWNWKTGYKFFSLVGNYYPKAAQNREGLVIHIGFNENYRTITFTLPKDGRSLLELKDGASTLIVLQANMMNVFNKPNQVDFKEQTTIMMGEIASEIADNYQKSVFTIQSIK